MAQYGRQKEQKELGPGALAALKATLAAFGHCREKDGHMKTRGNTQSLPRRWRSWATCSMIKCTVAEEYLMKSIGRCVGVRVC